MKVTLGPFTETCVLFFHLIATFSHYYIMLRSNRVKDYINHPHTPIIDINRTINWWPMLYRFSTRQHNRYCISDNI